MRSSVIAVLVLVLLSVPPASAQSQYSPDQDAYAIMQKASNLAQFADSVEQRNAMLGRLLADAKKKADDADKAKAALQKQVDDLTKQVADLKKAAAPAPEK